MFRACCQFIASLMALSGTNAVKKDVYTGKRTAEVYMPDGIYGPDATHAMREVANPTGVREADRNIFEWYGQALPDRMDGMHVFDWGAGVGRFYPLFKKLGVRSVTLIEPSDESLTTLHSQFDGAPDISVVKGGLGLNLPRTTSEKSTLHICNFVVNCLDSLAKAFELLARSVRPQEDLFLVTNVFAPKEIVDSIKDSRAQSARTIDIAAHTEPVGRLPVPRVFNNEIISNGQILRDTVHTLVDYSELWRQEQAHWNVVEAKLTLPDGFRHQIAPSEDFGDYKFAVLLMRLSRK